MLTRGSGRPTCVSRDHGQAPGFGMLDGQYALERRGDIGVGFLGLAST
jgi:hypothetical protein